MTKEEISPYHKIIYQCDICGLKYEDLKIYHYKDQGWEYFIDNLEPVIESWSCPNHPKETVTMTTLELEDQTS